MEIFLISANGVKFTEDTSSKSLGHLFFIRLKNSILGLSTSNRFSNVFSLRHNEGSINEQKIKDYNTKKRFGNRLKLSWSNLKFGRDGLKINGVKCIFREFVFDFP